MIRGGRSPQASRPPGGVAAEVVERSSPRVPGEPVDLSVAPETDLERLRELVAGLRLEEETWAEPPRIKGVVAMDATKLTVRITGRAEPGRQSAAELGLRQALREALTAAGVKLA